jgi:hypothetical protein
MTAYTVLSACKLVHVCGPVTRNERSPTVTNRDRDTKGISVLADDLSRLRSSANTDDLSRRPESMSATRCSDDDRYGGARSWRQRKTNVATLKSTLSTALNQCSSIKTGITWSDHRRLKIDPAAALMTSPSSLQATELVVRQAGQRRVAVV